MNHVSNLAGRLGLSLIFIVSGWGKIGGYAGTQQYMEAMGVPGALLPLVIALEVGGGLAVLAGLFTRPLAVLFALFALASGVLFHWNPADQMQTIMLMKNVAIAGGFALLAAHGAGALSVDALIARGRGRDALPAGGRA
jgi:putative oxidoreductase